MDVEIAEDLSPTTSGGHVLHGRGFVLDFDARRLLLPPPENKNIWMRTVLLGLGLLAEHHGPECVVSRGSKRLAPIPLHSSSVKTAKGALVFCGHSTFGKTTISTKLLDHLPLLGEDLNYALVGPFGVRSKPKAYIAEATDKRVPVRALFWLRKSLTCEIQPMAQSSAAAGMVHPIFGLQRPENARHRLAMLRRLLEAVSCQELSFRKEKASLRKLLRQHDLI